MLNINYIFLAVGLGAPPTVIVIPESVSMTQDSTANLLVLKVQALQLRIELTLVMGRLTSLMFNSIVEVSHWYLKNRYVN